MEEFTKLVELMETLRGEQGCPWDKKQTEKAFRTFLLEEVYELIEAIEQDDYMALKEELGDLPFPHSLSSPRYAEKQADSTSGTWCGSTYQKMYGRHPHVFSCKTATRRPMETRWEEIKKGGKGGLFALSRCPEDTPGPAARLRHLQEGGTARLRLGKARRRL